MGGLSLLQWIFPTQESKWGLLHRRWILYPLSYQGSPTVFCVCVCAFPFSRGSSQSSDWTHISHIAGGFFTSWSTREAKNTGLGSLSLLQRIFLIAQVVKNPPARLLSKRQQIIILGENVEKRKHSHTVVGNVNWCSCYGTIWNKIPQKIKKRTTIWSSNSTSRYLSKANKKTLIRKDISTSTFTALNMSANLENSAVATGLEKVFFHSNPKEGQSQRMFKLPHNCAHFTW